MEGVQHLGEIGETIAQEQGAEIAIVSSCFKTP